MNTALIETNKANAQSFDVVFVFRHLARAGLNYFAEKLICGFKGTPPANFIFVSINYSAIIELSGSMQIDKNRFFQ